jgi:uncharacterized protein YlxW (UPF0749 family)
MNPFVSRLTPKSDSWVLPVSVMSLVVGFMLSMAWVTERNRISRYDLLEPTQKSRVSEATIDIAAFEQMRDKVNSLQAANTHLENTLAKGGEASKVLNDNLQAVKQFSGLTPVEGPGVIVTLRDASHPDMKIGGETIVTADKNIHDLDVLRIVNELYSAGAEAIAINDHRITGGSSIRCVGPTILINDVKVASPIVVKAIGDPKTLLGALNLNGGILSEIRSSDPDMVQVEQDKLLKMDPYAGQTTYHFAAVPKDSK